MGVQWVLVCHGLITLLFVISFLCGCWPIFGEYDYFRVYKAWLDDSSALVKKRKKTALRNYTNEMSEKILSAFGSWGIGAVAYGVPELKNDQMLKISLDKKIWSA